MHERSLVMALLRQVERLRVERGGCRLSLIRVSVGEFSGVEPELLRLAFEDVVAAMCAVEGDEGDGGDGGDESDGSSETSKLERIACLRDGIDPAAVRGVRLEMEHVPLEAGCATCGREFAVERFRFTCPECGGVGLTILRGEGLMLESVTMEFDEP